jgi:hypothetical protein
MDGIATCVCGGLGQYENITERAYICLEMDKWAVLFRELLPGTCSDIALFTVLIKNISCTFVIVVLCLLF